VAEEEDEMKKGFVAALIMASLGLAGFSGQAQAYEWGHHHYHEEPVVILPPVVLGAPPPVVMTQPYAYAAPPVVYEAPRNCRTVNSTSIVNGYWTRTQTLECLGYDGFWHLVSTSMW
jgi:hypothetical protein